MKSISRNFSVFPAIIASLVCTFCFVAAEAPADTVIVPNYAATNQIDNSAEGLWPDVQFQRGAYSESPAKDHFTAGKPDGVAGGHCDICGFGIQSYTVDLSMVF